MNDAAAFPDLLDCAMRSGIGASMMAQIGRSARL
jgi:hypothetical protein